MKKEREVNYSNIKYGMLVEVLSKKQSSNFHAGMKVHFFNHKGVLLGNIYQFLPYDRLRLREPNENGRDRSYPRNFMNEKFEGIKTLFFLMKCNAITWLIRNTQKHMHKL
jgi:hypothetical protein